MADPQQMKPIEGAESEGALGFFKGMGKGLVGYVHLSHLYYGILTQRCEVLSRNLWSAFSILHPMSLRVFVTLRLFSMVLNVIGFDWWVWTGPVFSQSKGIVLAKGGTRRRRIGCMLSLLWIIASLLKLSQAYNPREALGQYWLQDLDNGSMKDQSYVAHLS